jgi:predicted ATPase
MQEPVYYYNNLPAPLTTLIGREENLAKAVESLGAEVRLLTLTGPGGVGKTRLAIQIGEKLLAQKTFAQGLCFVSLASLTDPGLVPLAIAEAAGIKEANGQPPLLLLKNRLRNYELLLVLDNFEQIIEASGVLTDLLSSCRKLKMLVTSRTVLHLYGEQELIIEPLALPASRSILPLELLQHSPALTLFVKRSQAVKADFKLTQENAQAVSDICFRLDGLPLALELIAPQVKLFTPQHILTRLNNWLSLIDTKTGNLPLRQQTMQNVLDWSYDLLDEAEQNLLAQLGVFVQGCTVEAVEAVCTFDANRHFFRKVKAKLQHTSHMVEHLSGLVDKSLLLRQEVTVSSLQITGDTSKMVRFRMLELVREYALEQLQARGEEEMLRENHLNYYLHLVEEVEPQLHRLSMGPLLKQLELEHDNLRAALRWSLEENPHDPARIEKGIRLTAALAWFWHFRGYWSEGSAWVEKALELANQTEISKIVQAEIWHAAGIFSGSQGQASKAFAQLEEGLKLFRELDDKWGIAHSYDWIAELHRVLGHYSEAKPFYEAAHELCVELKDYFCANLEQIGLGIISYQQGDYTTAQICLKNGLETSWGLRDKFGAGNALNALGELLRRQGDYPHALLYYKQSLSLFREMGLTGKVVQILHNIGQLELDRENFMEAEGFFKSSLVLSYEIKSKRMIAWCLAGLACAMCGQSRLDEAARLFGATRALLAAMNTSLDASNQASYKRSLLSFHELMPEPLGEAAIEEGANLPLEQVISAVLNKGVFIFDL